jgi:hypothetical protein
MTSPAVAATTAPSDRTSPSGTSTTPGWRSRVTCANVWSAASTAARGIGGTFGVEGALAISSYSDAPVRRGRDSRTKAVLPLARGRSSPGFAHGTH